MGRASGLAWLILVAKDVNQIQPITPVVVTFEISAETRGLFGKLNFASMLLH